jgi:hypothetical protein
MKQGGFIPVTRYINPNIMKYVYSAAIIIIGFFAIPAVLDFSDRFSDRLFQMSRGKDADDAPVASLSQSKAAVRVIKE